MITTGQKIRNLRKLYHITQAEFAKNIGINRGNLVSYENDVNNVPHYVIEKICLATGITQDYFDDNITLTEAFKISNLNINKPKFQNKQISTFLLYNSLQQLIDKKQPIRVEDNSSILQTIFDVDTKNFIFLKIKNKEGLPLAQDGDFLDISLDINLIKSYDWIIISYLNEVMIVRYNRISQDQISLQADDKKFIISLDEFKNIKIYAIVKNVISCKQV